jgi:sugar (pentulose or hexulose) kinase
VILCADIGSSSLKAALIDFDGRERAFAREPYPPEKLAAGENGSGAPITTADWEAAFAGAIRRLSAGTGLLRAQAVCISGNGPTVVPVTDGADSPAPLHWYDRRAPLAGNVEGRKSFFLPRAAWFMERRPREYAETRYLFSSQEWLSYRLGADPFTTLPSPAYKPYYWDTDQCAGFGIDPERFPPMVPLGCIVGGVSEEASRRFGLAEGIPLVSGGPDFIMALIGTGVLKPGMVCDRAGSSEGINICTAAPAAVPGLRTLPHAIEGLWNLGAVMPVSGRLFDWYRHITDQENRPYAEILESFRAPGMNRLLRRVSGAEFPAVFQRGGTAFSFPQGLPSRVELGVTVLESLGFMVRRILDDLAARNFPVEEMRLSGGQAKSPLWNRFKADITGVRLLAPEILDGELAGDACAAAAALGEASGIEEAARNMIRIKHTYESDPVIHARYEEQYAAYREAERRFVGDEDTILRIPAPGSSVSSRRGG